ncbi:MULTISPECIES: ABC transporter permease [unclassified Leucobacter]|uniref:ABC transporter permease n=1 Tax=unclassified Leucobacter TaxID=2621730 RepID=UPI00165E8AD7|nr:MULTISPECIES: ABC transporter permease [unclassified Leucobacter]MBC9936715.1 ABC transporter permease [Leucobacter sp. cx-87]
MWRFLASRIGSALFVLLALTIVVFVLTRVIPSDPAVVFAGPKAPPEELARVREALGFDRPLPMQYFDYLGGLLSGDWGNSLSTRRPVLLELATRLPATLELLLAAMSFALVAGVALGVLATRRPGGPLDGVIRFLAIGGISMPVFWLGLLLQVLFVGRLGILPATGQFSTELAYVSPITSVTGFPLFDSLITGNWVAWSDGMAHLVLPMLTLAAYPLGLVARMTRASMLEVQSQEYIFTARAYGLRDRSIRWRLSLKNALPPTLTVAGLSAAYALTGTFFVEIVFNWPGIGQFAANAMLAVDYPAIMAITMLGALGYLLANLVVDVCQARIDPRVRLTRKGASV